MFDIAKVFLEGFIIDLMYVLYIWSATKEYYVFTALTSIGVAAPATFGLVAIVDNNMMAIPYFVGLAFGSIAGIYLKKKINKEKAPL